MPSRRRSSAAAIKERGASNNDLTDLEMLHNIKDAIGADGWATTTEIAVECGFSSNGGKSRTPATKVASRLAWMRDGGLVESTNPDPDARPSNEPGSHDMRWRPTEIGYAIVAGNLSKAVTNALGKMGPGEQIQLMRQLGQGGYVEGDVAIAFALRREFRHHEGQRKLQLRR